MKCLSPIRIQLGSGVSVFKEGQVRGYTVPCGQCISCRLNYAKFWSIRMMQEFKHHDKACFATLTYDDDNLPMRLLPCGECVFPLVKSDLQKFWKLLRKYRKVRYFACGEYGDRFGRPHYHAIIYGVDPSESALIEKCWHRGQIKLGTVTPDSCNYVAKYMVKKLKGSSLDEKLAVDPDYVPEFVLMSRRPGIGAELTPQMEQFLRQCGFVYRKGKRSSIPRYYKDKLDIHVPFHGEIQSLEDERLWLRDFDKHDIYMNKKLILRKS